MATQLAKVEDSRQYLSALPQEAQEKGARDQSTQSNTESMNARIQPARVLHPIAALFKLVSIFDTSLRVKQRKLKNCLANQGKEGSKRRDNLPPRVIKDLESEFGRADLIDKSKIKYDPSDEGIIYVPSNSNPNIIHRVNLGEIRKRNGRGCCCMVGFEYCCAHCIAAVEDMGNDSKIADYFDDKDTLIGWKRQLDNKTIKVPQRKNLDLKRYPPNKNIRYPPPINDIRDKGKKILKSGAPKLGARKIGIVEQKINSAKSKAKRVKKNHN